MQNKRVSVILTTKNEERNIRTFLDSVKNQTHPNIEVIVVDNNSTDNTKSIANEFTDKVYNVGPERSVQRNYGVSKATGEYVLILDADMKLSPDVVFECVEKVESEQGVKALIIPEQSFGISYWAKCKALERNCYIGDNTIEAARFFDKKIYLKLGGFNEKMISGEDWDLSNRIRKAGYTISRVNSKIYHNEGNLSLVKTLKKKAYYSDKSGEYIENNITDIKQVFLFIFRPAYFRNWRLLLQDPFHTVGFIFMKILEILVGGFFILRKKYFWNSLTKQ